MRVYSRGSVPSAASGYGVSRLVGTCMCSGNQIDSKPRSSAARASSAGFMASSVAKMNTPSFIVPSLR